MDDDGSLAPFANEFTFPAESLVALLEFCLVEAVEPALNRKQGDTVGFDELEFFQREDPSVEERRKKSWMRDLVDRIS